MALDMAHSQRKLLELPIDSILPNPNQPRLTFDEESIAELAQSISQVGLIQPLVVRRGSGGYELVAGERRLRACKSLGMATVTCIVEEKLREESSAMMALIENLQREDLHYMEEAQTLSDRIAILQEGSILLTDTPAAILEKTCTERLEDAFIRIVRGDMQ